MTSRCEEFRHRLWTGLSSCYSKDIERFLNKGVEPIPDDLKHRLSAIATPELLAILLYRISHLLFTRGHRRLGRLVAALNMILHHANLTPQSCIGPGFHMPHPAGISFAGSAGAGLTLYSMATCGALNADPDPALPGCPALGDNVTLAAHAAVMGAVGIGSNVKVAYSVRVTRDVPPNSVVVTALRIAMRSQVSCA